MPTLSIVIPAYNEERFIGTLLEQVRTVPLDDIGVSREVIVVDDGSKDGTSAIVGGVADVRLHRLPVKSGKGAAVRAGMGREAAHEVIKENAVAVALAMREHGAEPDLLDRLAADPRLPLDRVALDAALADKQAFTGAAGNQIDEVVTAVDELVSRYPEAAKYTSDAIL